MTDNTTDKEFVGIAGDLINVTKALYEYGIARKLMTPEDMRLTIAKRQETAKALVESGMSQRQAAAVLGIPRSTLQEDLKPRVDESRPKSGRESSTEAPPSSDESKTTRELLAQSDQNDWRTPRKFLDSARAVMGAIDLDPATSIEANETVKATKIYTEIENGLLQPWKGRVWLNPPYGGDARVFVERILKEYQVGNVTAACLLVNSHPTETKWFQELFAHAVCFVRGRIDFGGPSRAVASTSTHGSAIVYLGENETKFAEEFAQYGSVVRRIK